MYQPTTISTVGDRIDNRYTLWLHCYTCGRHARADLKAIAKRLGRDTSYIGGLPLRCSECGAREPGLGVHPPGR